jgi:hypothetical protein
MKKNIIISIFLLLFHTLAFAAVKNNKEMTIDFTLNYKVQASGKVTEHVMKNNMHLIDGQWNIAGKLQSSKDDSILLFLVRLLSQKKNKFTLQFMIIDADNKNTFVMEPKMTLLPGLPAQLKVNGNDRSADLNVLIKLASKS